MSATLVPTVRTQSSQVELTKAFIEAWIALLDNVPTEKQIAVLYAQNAIETGETASMWNWNIGNIKYVAKPSDGPNIEYCMLKNVFEYVNGKKVFFQPPHPATWFRSFKNLTSGTTYYFNFLRNNRYKNAWPSVEAGDPAEFSRQLRKSGYYTAPADLYIKAMEAYFNKFLKAKYYDGAMALIKKDTSSNYSPSIDAGPGSSSGIIHPPTDLNKPALTMPEDSPLKITTWKKIQNFVSDIFKKN